jgi:hypothetical protein
VAKEDQDAFLEEIDQELKDLHLKVKKIVSQADAVLNEYGEKDGAPEEGSERDEKEGETV